MHLNAFFPSPSLFSLIITLFLYSSHASNPEFERCTPFECGKFKGLRYPFWTDFSPPPFCGHPDCHLDCQQDNPSMSINSVEYTIIDIHPDSRILTIARKDYFEEDGICQTQSNRNIFMDGTLLRHTKSNLNALIFYDCEPFENTTMIYNFSCPQKNGHFVVDPPHEFEVSLMRRHDPVKVWVLRKAVEKLRGLYSVNITDISNILREGFEVEWVLDEKICRECEGLGGRCAWNFTESLCFCPEGDYRTRCHIPPPPIPSSPSTAPTNKISNKGQKSINPSMRFQKMHAHLFCPLLSHSLLFIFFLSLPLHRAQDSDQFSDCSTPFRCGETLEPIGFPPFWGADRPSSCGVEGYYLRCNNNDYATIDIAAQTFRVLHVNQSNQTIRIAREDLWGHICPSNFVNTSMNDSLFEYASNVRQLNLYYACPRMENMAIRNTFECVINRSERIGYYADESFSGIVVPNFNRCEVAISVPVLRTALQEFRVNESMEVPELLNCGFDLVYRVNSRACSACLRSGGFCSSDTDASAPTCLCRGGPQPYLCPDQGNGLNEPQKIGIGIGVAGTGILLICLVFFIYHRRFRKRYASSLMSRNISSDPSSITDLEKSNIYFGVHIFSYAELEEATNNFDSKKELGDGGFGTVYKGKLRDGRVVAVKRLYENNFKRVEQFMNEVEILTRLRHQNLVTLYGCTSRHCRELLLVYEYIPNGTVADHLHGDRAGKGLLTWKTRMSIAVETASALAFLHASDVIHRDVKTNNILLESNFRVKVADFGLSRLFPTNVTHVSTAPQGTPGYVDPEYHHCYQLTDKSDVFSFGVVLVELISSMPAVDITRHRHEINLSTMAINKIQRRALNELVDPNLGFDSDYKARKMINDVAELAFQCLQNGREMRPSMEEVLEALKEIRRQDYGEENGDDDAGDVPPDDAVLLKSNPLILSPDSVTANWVSSNSTTTNASG